MLGAKLVLMSPFDWVRAPQRLLQAVSKERGTLSWLPNFAFNFCAQKIREGDLNGIDLSSWRGVINCSEPVLLDSQRQFLRRFRSRGLNEDALGTSYAMAENVFAVTQSRLGEQVPFEVIDRDLFEREHVAKPVTDHKGLALMSSGQPIQGTDVRIVNDAGEKLAERFVGEIIVQSDCLFSGYFQREDLNARAFQDGWFLTGDLGYLAEGNLYVTGRKKDLIIVGGRNIYPQDLEAIASGVEGVHPGRACAFGVYREKLGTEEVVMVAESELEGEAARRELKEKVRIEVNRGSDVVLSRLQIVDPDWLFKTSSGKIARAANRERYLNRFEAGR
jgi:acyl-CoA synthetase (AMP-forming)/AMP-acid ligase II